ncbi:MAG TPA: PQQ-binding-like beta-propeller repeat protein [Baekduia sp.]
MVTATALALAVGAGSAAAVSETTTYQGDAGHSGGVSDPALDGPLHVLWSDRFNQGLSYPLVAGGRVFVLSPASGDSPISDLEALDATTGARLWQRQLQSASGLTYGDGAVYAINHHGLVVAIDAVTGVTRWASQPSTLRINEPTAPVYYGGTIFYNGLTEDGGSAVVALDARDGALRWYAPMSTYAAQAVVAADAQGVYIGTECGYGMSWTLTGTQRWTTSTPCYDWSPGFGEQTVVAGARVFSDARSGAVLDTTTGAIVDEFVRPYRSELPAFGADHVAVLSDGVLTIADRATLKTTASYTANNPDLSQLLAQPFFVDGRVFTVDNRFHLIGVDAATATVSADVDLNSQLALGDDAPANGTGGIGVGGGVLAVAMTDGRVVAVTGPDGPTIPPLPPLDDAPAPPGDPGAAPAVGSDGSSPGPTDLPAPSESAPVPEPAPSVPAAAASAPVARAGAAIPSAARRITFPDGAKLEGLRERGLTVAVTGARTGARAHAILTVGGKVVWQQTVRVPKNGRLRLRAIHRATRAKVAHLEVRVSATHATTLVLRRTLR